MLITEPPEAPTEKQMEDALRELVDALMKYRAKRRPRQNTEFVAWTAAALVETPTNILDARGWASNPIDRALTKAMRHVGQHLYDALGSTDALRDVVERICKPRSREFGRRMSALDAALNGVGRDGDCWFS
jgi:hypothetical protein